MICIFILFIAMFWYDVFYNYLYRQFSHAIGTTKQQPNIFLRGAVIRLVGNAPLICGLFISLKVLKNWHIKELENEQLTREKTNAELQLLKAQIHPHFLFNTLNNIYSFTLTKSSIASELVQKLSDMLNYMIAECDQSLVPVEKEIQLIKDYISLEKVRYGDRLDIQMHVNGDCKKCMIVPLLMIPFVENCFKHGASVMRGKQWMHLIININENDLDFSISNSKPSQPQKFSNKNGIGLLNVQKRLELLYPRKHELNINSTDHTFSVYLKVALEKQSLLVTQHKHLLSHNEIIFKPNIHY
ncbi:MAG: histidine kinase [Bacteroidota bacterium]|nr:histidine kinase [Bacteroidota bacterium]